MSVFAGDAAVLKVVEFGTRLFAQTDAGWRIIDQVAPAGSVDHED